MKNNTLKISLAIIAILSLSACSKNWNKVPGAGPIHTEERYISDFSGIDFQLSGHVNVVQDSVSYVSINTYDNYLPLITTHVRNGRLVIDSQRSLEDDNIHITVHLPHLNYIDLSGSGSLTTRNYFYENNIEIRLSGSGKVDFAGDVHSLYTKISGSGRATLTGTAEHAEMIVSGSGKVRAYPLATYNNTVTISGSGSVETDVSNVLDVSITGSGKVYYSGRPVVYHSITGSGDLVHTY